MTLLQFVLSALLVSSTLAHPPAPAPIAARDSQNNRCGPSFNNNSCSFTTAQYRCCSQYNYCGDTAAHCGTGCQPAYGICSGSSPAPTSTSAGGPVPSAAPRPRLGSLPYGMNMYSCSVNGRIALTYDDGPYLYTGQLLDILKAKGVKVTFFVTGNNLDKGAIDGTDPTWRNIIKRAYTEGHQIASHTWDHLDLDSIDETSRRFQMTRLETALTSILGFYPTYMRPPYIRCGGPCLNTMDTLGYHVIIWDLDTDDYNNITPQLIENAKRNVRVAVDGTKPADRNFMSIAHDIHQQTVINLTSYQIDLGIKNGYQHVRLGDCLGDPEANWYRK